MNTISIDQHIAQFKDLFDRFELQLNGEKQHPIHGFRQKAAERLEQLRFPTRRDEDYKYTSFARLLNLDYQLSSDAQANAEKLAQIKQSIENAISIVTINGKLAPELSDFDNLPKGLSLMSLEDALLDPRFSTQVENFLKAQSSSDNVFAVLNASLTGKGLFIHAEKNAVIEQNIHLIQYQAKNDAPFASNPLRLVIAETGAQLSIVDTHYGETDAEYFSNVLNHFEIAANAHVYHYKFQMESAQGYQVNNTTAFQDQDSTYTNLALDLGGRIVRNNLSAIHRGENITSNLFGACLANGDQHVDNQTFIDHAVPHCQSNELYKTVLDDRSKGIFNGKVLVRKDAQKTNAYQQNSSLVLSNKAVMDSKPQLEIFADDVKCSHGATIGQLDQASLFYLKSRGMPDKMARETLQYAFLIDVLNEISNETVKAAAEALVYQKFGA